MRHRPPRLPDAYDEGQALARAGRHAEAIERFGRALARRPDDRDTLYALGRTAEAVGDTAAAESFYRRVLDLAPDQLEALVALANLLRAGARAGDAIALLQPAIRRAPGKADLWMTLGSAVRETGDAVNAEIFYREALRLAPRSGAVVGNLAELLADAGDLDGALALCERAVRLDPRSAQARLNRGLLRLQAGQLAEGWRDYEQRLRIPGRAILADHGLPAWQGDTRRGLRLLFTAEQGVGDQLMFASLIPELAARLAAGGGRLVLEAEPRLVPLFERSFPEARVAAWDLKTIGGQTRAAYGWLEAAGGADAVMALGSLPALLRPAMDAFPDRHAYLAPDPVERARWRAWLTASGPGPHVGVSWRSGLSGGLREREYAPLDAWAAFIRDLPGSPVMLQYGAGGAEIEALAAASGRSILVPPGLDQRMDLDRTAALAAGLDAVISAPTATAWLAAAVGTPTLKLLYKDSWTAFGGEHEPFAPACRLVRAPAAGDWAGAFALARTVLAAALTSPP
ncbi:tetratricopeptide repeat protein [Caulobacter sp. KR2-114]|uniref:tetratricopeptide repeat protein n=1 Tax=Caulobacter sp. KR2-114 TaxID=3400912 RepID=UPI003C00A017